MQINLQIENKEDLEYFKTLFLRNFGTEQMVYYFHVDDVVIQTQVAGYDGGQMISMGFFSIEKNGPYSSKTQFCPLADVRYTTFKVIQDIWGWNATQAWGSFVHVKEGIESALQTIIEIVNIVYKVSKLKAFI